MLHRQEGSSENLRRDVQIALLWNQLNALHYQAEQSNHQPSLQQNLILGLQDQLLHRCLQRGADQNPISKLVGKLFQPECCKPKSPTAEPRAAEEPVVAEGGPPTTAALAACLPCRVSGRYLTQKAPTPAALAAAAKKASMLTGYNPP